jgi:hypothetical protein
MEETVAVRPGCTVRKFSSHAEQEEADLRYWRDQPVSEKVKAVAELAEYFAAMHKVDLIAQGPKRVVSRFERPRR